MVALALAQAIIALHGHAKVAIGWVVGMAVFVAVVAIPNDDLLLRVESALVAGSLAAMIVFAVVLRGLIHSRRRARRGLALRGLRRPADGAVILGASL